MSEHAIPVRKLEPGWLERHARILVESGDPGGKIPLTFLDGSPVLDRRGQPRHYSAAVDSFAGLGHRRARERELRRQAARASDAARVAAETSRIRREAVLGVLPPPGRLCAVDMDALLIVGPLGAIGGPAGLLRTLQVLAQGKRRPVADLLPGWRDEAALAAAIEALRPRLAAVGLRICRRKAGWRLAAATV